MDILQVRLPEKLIAEIDRFVNKGHYPNKSELVRDAIRRFLLEQQIGSIPNIGDSVKDIRDIRKKLSRKRFDLRAINKLAE